MNWKQDAGVRERKFLSCATGGGAWEMRMPSHLTREDMVKSRCIGEGGVFSF